MRYLLTATLGLLSTLAFAQTRETPPPDQYFRTVTREAVGSLPTRLVERGRPVFSIMVSDAGDEVLATAASDLARYFQQRWGEAPAAGKIGDRNLVVLATPSTMSRLPKELRVETGPLPDQGFLIQRVALGRGAALVCVGGSPIGARYATVEILRRMNYDSTSAAMSFERLREEPYSTFRAVYINDSAHQLNNYNFNFVYDVPTYRWPMAKWKRYIDQMAFFRYNVLQIWLVPQMFSPDVFAGGGVFDYVRDTLREVGRYAGARGIKLCLTNGINVAVKAGTRLDSLPIYRELPVYTYLSPNKPEEKALSMRLWDYWSKALREVAIWQLFPGDPGGCHEEGCGPETYVDLAIEVSRIIKKNNPSAIIDFCPWQFFGWGPSWITEMRKDSKRIDRGYQYLLSRLDEFPRDTIFSPNLNDFTSQPPVRDAGFGGGSAASYIQAIHGRGHLIHTWTYFVTEGEGWINHAYKVPGILRQRDVEARYPIAGGLCYTMTPSLNILNQFACAEAFWNPKATELEIMQRYTEGIFGAASRDLISIFPSFDVAPMVGYTFSKAPNWKPDYEKILSGMRRSRQVLTSLALPARPRFEILPSPREYADELLYFVDLYTRLSTLGQNVARARELEGKTRSSPEEEELRRLRAAIRTVDVEAMKKAYRTKHYQVFLDAPSEFTPLLPHLIDGFFVAFGTDYVQ